LAKIFIHIQFHQVAKFLAARCGGNVDRDGSGGDSPQGTGKGEVLKGDGKTNRRGCKFDMGFYKTEN
jgi:hypothetical protein